METKGEIRISGVTVVVSDAPSDYHVAPRTENPNLASGSAPTVAEEVSITPAVEAVAAAGEGSVLSLKKKRGRPRKYGPDGSITALSPKPISSSARPPSPVIDFSTGKGGKIRGVGSGMKYRQQSTLVNNRGDWVSCSSGSSFTPHMITVNSGEDVTMKVISFSQQGPRVICIISGNGVISSVTLRRPDSSGGTLTYEGRFEILSLTGSFMASEDGGGFKNRSGSMNVSLLGPDGKIVGGSVAGLLVAASPVQILVGSFLAVDHKPIKLMKNDCNSSNEQEAQNQNQKPRNNIQTDINVSPPS